MAVVRRPLKAGQKGGALIAVLMLATMVTMVLLGSLQQALASLSRVAVDLQLARMERLLRSEAAHIEARLRHTQNLPSLEPSSGMRVTRQLTPIDCPTSTETESEVALCTQVEIHIDTVHGSFHRHFSGRWRHYLQADQSSLSGWY